MTSSNGNIFRVTGHLCGEFTGPRWIPRTKASDAIFDVFFDLCLNKRLSKQSWGWWFETLSRPLWRHFNGFSSLAPLQTYIKKQGRTYDGTLKHMKYIQLTHCGIVTTNGYINLFYAFREIFIFTLLNSKYSWWFSHMMNIWWKGVEEVVYWIEYI